MGSIEIVDTLQKRPCAGCIRGGRRCASISDIFSRGPTGAFTATGIHDFIAVVCCGHTSRASERQ